MTDWDVIIIGRSYAGLSAALTLGRARFATLVIGDGPPRNTSAEHVHGMLTRDHQSPADIVRAAEQDIERYPTVQLERGHVSVLEVAGDTVRVRFGDRTTTAAAVVLATGVNDEPPAIAGVSEHWGRGVFTCPFCDGYEHADEPWALLGPPTHAAHAKLLCNWAAGLTVFDPDPDGEVERALKEAGVADARVERRPIRRVHGDGSRLESIELADGERIPVVAAFVPAVDRPNNQLALAVGCAVDDGGYVQVDGFCETSVPGVWAVGDLIRAGRHQMTFSVADGVNAATAITRRLVVERPLP